MQDIQKRIDEIESQAAESALIADLATHHEARIYNGRLARELREFAGDLRKQAQNTRNVRPSFAGIVRPSSDGRAR
jgi:transposase